MNIMTRQILSYLTGLDVDEFDVGSALPTFREISIAEKSSTGCPGFVRTVTFPSFRTVLIPSLEHASVLQL
jgi:hypothetical protein